MKVSNRLRVLRAERRWSQRELARRASTRIRRFNADRLWRIENGYADPTPEEQARLARALRVPVVEVFPDLKQEARAS